MFRKFAAIFILFCLVVPFAGSYGWLQYEKRKTRKAIKRQMIAGIDKAELVLLKFTTEQEKTALRWEHSKEFEYEGQMYDVVSTTIVGDTTHYYCWWDHKETKLNKELSVLVTKAMGSNPEQQDKQQQLEHFIKTLYFESASSISADKDYSFSATIFYPSQQEDCINHSNAPPTPPPKTAIQIG